MCIKASALIGQVVEVNFAFETNNNDFDILVGEIQIQSKWTGVEVLSNNYVWEFAGTNVEDFRAVSYTHLTLPTIYSV